MLNFVKSNFTIPKIFFGYMTYEVLHTCFVSTFVDHFSTPNPSDDLAKKKYVFVLDETTFGLFSSATAWKLEKFEPKVGHLVKYFCIIENKEKIGIVVGVSENTISYFSKVKNNSKMVHQVAMNIPKHFCGIVPFDPKYLKSLGENQLSKEPNADAASKSDLIASFNSDNSFLYERIFISNHMIRAPVFTIVDLADLSVSFEDYGFVDMSKIPVKLL